MDLIVCGDALWISCGTWVAFWGGAFGAFVAAVIGGLVALLVVRLTNGQQTRQAAAARETTAVAEVIGLAETLSLSYSLHREFNRWDQFRLLRAAMIRLRISGADSEELWPYLARWCGDFMLLVVAESGPPEKPEMGNMLKMHDAVSTLSNTLIQWNRSDSKSRKKLVAQLLTAADFPENASGSTATN